MTALDLGLIRAAVQGNVDLNQSVAGDSSTQAGLSGLTLTNADGSTELPASDFLAEFITLFPELAQTLQQQLQAGGKATLDDGQLKALMAQIQSKGELGLGSLTNLLSNPAILPDQITQAAASLNVAQQLKTVLPQIKATLNSQQVSNLGTLGKAFGSDDLPSISMLLSQFQGDPELQQQFNQLLGKTSIGDQLTIPIQTNNSQNTAFSPMLNSAFLTNQNTTIQAPIQEATIAAPVNSPNWSNALSERVVWLSTQQIQSASIKLNPPELGPLEVNIKFNHDQPTVVFSSQNAAVREAIEQALPRLREMFEQTGMSLADANVSDQALFQQQQEDDTATNPVYGDNSDIQIDPETGEKITTTMVTLGRQLIDFYA